MPSAGDICERDEKLVEMALDHLGMHGLETGDAIRDIVDGSVYFVMEQGQRQIQHLRTQVAEMTVTQRIGRQKQEAEAEHEKPVTCRRRGITVDSIS